MGFWDAVPAIAGAVGKIASRGAQGSADQRYQDNNSAAQRNALLAQLYGIQQNATQNALTAGSNEKINQGNLDLNRREFALSAPSKRASQSVRGSILQNAQRAKISGVPAHINVPTIEGGLSPDLFNADTRALGGELTRSAIMDQLKGDTFDPMTPTDFSSGILGQPKLEDFQKSGLLEQILGGLGLAGSAIGAVDTVNNRRKDADEDLEASYWEGT